MTDEVRSLALPATPLAAPGAGDERTAISVLVRASVDGVARSPAPLTTIGVRWGDDVAGAILRLPAESTSYLLAKRALDVMVCAFILPWVLLCLAIAAVAIRLDSPGPILFRQTRIGKGGTPFVIFKLRTLQAEFDEFAARDVMRAYVRGIPSTCDDRRQLNKPFSDASVTRVGRFLRRTSLDELPQIWHVLRGEMSLVGPRPNVPWEVGAYEEWHYARLAVLPGITGLAQVSGRSYMTFDEIALADIEYVRRRSLGFDLMILWRTVTCLIGRDGAG